jgi:hypothetical protein
MCEMLSFSTSIRPFLIVDTNCDIVLKGEREKQTITRSETEESSLLDLVDSFSRFLSFFARSYCKVLSHDCVIK